MALLTTRSIGPVLDTLCTAGYSLAGLAAGGRATITRLTLPPCAQERVMEMGLVPGTEVTVVRAGRRHLVVSLRGFTLGLGRTEAAGIEVAGARRHA